MKQTGTDPSFPVDSIRRLLSLVDQDVIEEAEFLAMREDLLSNLDREEALQWALEQKEQRLGSFLNGESFAALREWDRTQSGELESSAEEVNPLSPRVPDPEREKDPAGHLDAFGESIEGNPQRGLRWLR